MSVFYFPILGSIGHRPMAMQPAKRHEHTPPPCSLAGGSRKRAARGSLTQPAKRRSRMRAPDVSPKVVRAENPNRLGPLPQTA